MERAGDPLCVILAPFNGAWGAVHQAVADALSRDGVVVRWETGGAEQDLPASLAIHEDLMRAAVVIADVTEANPNVMYEMGFAQARRKSVLPVVEKHREVPAVVWGRLFFVYDATDPGPLVEFVRTWVGRHAGIADGAAVG